MWYLSGPVSSQLADAMELMLLSVLSPAVKCQWGLSTYEEAAITSVHSIYHNRVQIG